MGEVISIMEPRIREIFHHWMMGFYIYEIAQMFEMCPVKVEEILRAEIKEIELCQDSWKH